MIYVYGGIRGVMDVSGAAGGKALCTAIHGVMGHGTASWNQSTVQCVGYSCTWLDGYFIYPEGNLRLCFFKKASAAIQAHIHTLAHTRTHTLTDSLT